MLVAAGRTSRYRPSLRGITTRAWDRGNPRHRQMLAGGPATVFRLIAEKR